MLTQLKGLFTPAVVGQHMKALPPLQSTIMDLLYPDRPQKPFPVVGIQEIQEVAGTIPLVMRGGLSIPVGNESAAITTIEPLPIKPSKKITGQDLNNLRMILPDRASLAAWTRDTIDYLRRTVRATTEGIACTALTGKISWPVRLDGAGYEVYEVNYGTPLSVTPEDADKLDADGATVATVEALLDEMETAIQEAGVGGDVEYMAGKKAFSAISRLVEKLQSTADHGVKKVKGGFDFNGRIIRKCSERYRNPNGGAMVSKIPDHKILAYAKDAPGKIIYCALDNIDSKLLPLPFFPAPYPLPEGTGVSIVGHSKALPVRSPKSICWAAAVTP